MIFAVDRLDQRLILGKAALVRAIAVHVGDAEIVGPAEHARSDKRLTLWACTA